MEDLGQELTPEGEGLDGSTGQEAGGVDGQLETADELNPIDPVPIVPVLPDPIEIGPDGPIENRPIKSKETLKTFFEKGDIPEEEQFADLIDAFRHINDGHTIADVTTDPNGIVSITLSNGAVVAITPPVTDEYVPKTGGEFTGNIGIGGPVTDKALHTYGSQVRIETAHGYGSLGAENADAFHFETDLPEIWLGSDVRSYGDLGLSGKNTFMRYDDGAILENNQRVATQNWVNTQSSLNYVPKTGGEFTGGISASQIFSNGHFEVNGDVIGNMNSKLREFSGAYFSFNGNAYGNDPLHALFSTNDPGVTGIGLVMNSIHNIRLNIDSNGNSDTAAFEVGADSSGVTGSTLFSVNEHGETRSSGSIFENDQRVATQSWTNSQGFLKENTATNFVRKDRDENNAFFNDYLIFNHNSTSDVDAISFNPSTNGFYFNAATGKSNSSANASVYVNKVIAFDDIATAESVHVAGNVYAGAGSQGSSYFGDGKEILKFTDEWLRLNPSTTSATRFDSGIYCGTSKLRTDGQFEVGSNGDKFKVTTSGAVSAAGTLTTGSNIGITPGHGKGFRFWGSDSYKVYMSSSTDGTWGGRVNGETTSDYNMYFRMTGGTNRGFVFKNDHNEVAGIDASGNARFNGTIYEGGTALSNTYLGKAAKATDSDKLDGIDSTGFVRDGIDSHRSWNNEYLIFTHNGVDNVDAISYDDTNNAFHFNADRSKTKTSSNAKVYAGTLYEGSTALTNKYLGKTAKAADSNLLDGKDSSAFLLKTGGTMTGSLTVSGSTSVSANEFRVGNSNTKLTKGANNSFKMSTNNGYIDVGAQNTSYAHFQSNLPKFYFNKSTEVNGDIKLYQKNTYLRHSDGAVIENGTRLTDKYLGKTAKAADSEKVDGINGASLLRSDANDTFTGTLSVGSSSTRQAGIYGIYDSTKIGHIWSMGTGFKISQTGANFGNLYGFAYKHTNNPTGGTMAGNHQAVWCSNGAPRVALGDNIWTSGTIYANGSITSAGNVTAYSDKRLKTALQPIKENILDKIDQLKPTFYQWKDQSKDQARQLGFIAQEVKEVFPEWVHENEEYYSMSYDKMGAVLAVQGIQELRAEIKSLKEELKTLKDGLTK